MAELSTTTLAADANLVAYYRLESGALTTPTTGTFTLTNGNTVTEVTGKYTGGAGFVGAGSNQYLGTANDLGITNGSCSLVAWINMQSAIASSDLRRFIVRKGDGGAHVAYFIDYQYNSGTPRLNFERLRENIVDDQVLGTVTLGTGVWFHVALTYDTSNVIGYLNGTAQGTTASSGDGASAETDSFIIGNNSTVSPTLQADAFIDDVAVFKRALTAAEIGTLYADAAVASTFPGYRSLLGVGI